MKRMVFLAVGMCLAVLVAGGSRLAAEPAAAPADRLLESTQGRPDAKVTVEEYSSLGCPHCSDFHLQILPRIKAQYIDAGKVRWIVRDFPLGQLPLAGAVVARCAGPGGYLELLEVLFRAQEQWMDAQDPIGSLETIAQKAGIQRPQFESCLMDDALIKRILDRARDAQKAHKVSATPTFIVNGEKVVGLMSFDEFARILDRHLAKASTP
ncbi:DsbA family protein [Rhodoplanes azumiensis]|uniref:DsbA family protein n=1 Tax=Rhodoplanes azumiensis TaxID=1897628 RepID=A0ABW5AFH3_9BRAD